MTVVKQSFVTWYLDADHQFSLSTQALILSLWRRVHECVTSVVNNQSHALRHRASMLTSRERPSEIRNSS